ncbi:MAG: PilZ domain-containing protein [Mariprofundus sp.]|nr:PilZ domain-containing protein [Mariprofundus sp.]
MKLYHNQRQYTRSKVPVAATLTPEDGDSFGVEVVDLSMGGVFIHSDQQLKDGSRCQLNMLLGHVNHELPIIADAIVIRSSESGIALRFEAVNLESISGMQNIIVEHAEDPDQATMEFSAHGGWIFSPK